MKEQMNIQLNSSYRYYYYYGSFSAWRIEAAMGCPGVMIV